MSFTALVARQRDSIIETEITLLSEDDLMPGDVDVAVEWSAVNYKDGLALAPSGKIIRTFPLIPGIDLAGTVHSSRDARYAIGDRVVLNGWGLSQTHHGGYAEKARVPADWLVKLPDRISTRDAMIIGTAGFTAMLSILALEKGGVRPGAGEILVTGGSGGVGSIAIILLAKLGHQVVASTGRLEEEAYLRDLGAHEIIDRATLEQPGPPLQGERWAGAIDVVGSHTLANVLAQTRYQSTVTACGLAQGFDLPASMGPFILRGITLSGIDSVNAPSALRASAWSRLAEDLDLDRLSTVVTEINLEDVPVVAANVLKGQVRGRTLVKIQG